MLQKLITNSGIYFIVALLLVIPLYPKFPLANLFNSYVAVRLEDFVIALIIGIWFVYQLTDRFRAINRPVSKSLLIYLGIGFVSIFSAIFVTKTASPGIGLLHTFRRVEYMVLFLVGYSFLSRLAQLGFVIRSLILVSFFVAIYGLGQQFLGFPVISTSNSEFAKGLSLTLGVGARINSTFAGHYDLAAFTIFPLLLIMGLFLYPHTPLRTKIMLLVVGSLVYWCMLLSASRVTFAAFFITSGIFLLLLKKPVYLAFLAIVAIVSIIYSPALLGRYQEFVRNHLFSVVTSVSAQAVDDQVPDALQPSAAPEDRSLNIRLKAEWPRAWRAFIKNPLLGTGYSSVGLATDNDYLRALAETGTLGFFAMGILIYRIFRSAVPFIKSPLTDLTHLFVTCLTCSLFGLLLNAVFIDVFEASKIAIITWLLLGVAYKAQYLYDHK